MLDAMYALPFAVLEVPRLKVKKPAWICMPQPMMVFALVMVSYFLVTAGVIYDVINEPPSIGHITDKHGNNRPVAFMAYRVNGQYIMEGLASALMFSLGALGFIILDKTHEPGMPKFNRSLFIFVGFSAIIISFSACYSFMKIKLPGYKN